MRDIIIVSAHKRTDTLRECLYNLAQCEGISDHEVWLVEDMNRKSEEVKKEIAKIATDALHIFDHLWHRQWYGNQNSWDTQWVALAAAYYRSQTEFVYILEDDVMVAPDFLKWSQLAHRTFKPFVTCGVNMWTPRGKDSEAVGISNSDFAYWGVCMHTDNLFGSVAAHYRHPEESIHNELIQLTKSMVFPMMPRAFNVGLPVRQEEVFEHSPVSKLHIAEDRRHFWAQAYRDQVKWGF